MLKNSMRKVAIIVAVVVAGVVIILVTAGCSIPLGKDMDKSEMESDFIVKSPADPRDYRHVTLPSGLRVLLISDPDTDKAAVAVDVGVGSYDDPNSRLGLAHFLEHMLFLGNKKYPEVDGYFEYIRANGGSSNAYTSDVHTNYFFDINSNKLQPALDQLAQFFVSPTLDPKYVDRERHAVDSEYKLHAREDAWRLFSVMGLTSNPDHPKSRFNIGNLETLSNDDGVSLWQDLKSFYDKYYVAGNIKAVVYGKESIDILEQWVKLSFEGVPTGVSKDKTIGIKPYAKNQLGVRINLVPIDESRSLYLDFPMESIQPYFRKKPVDYLSRMLGYEGKGSLHSMLKELGLINSLGVSCNDLANEYCEFSISMDLTLKGLDKVDDITAMVFDYLDLIGKEGMRESFYLESKDIAKLNFRYQQDIAPQHMVSSLAVKMRYVPVRHILDANYLYEEYDSKLIKSFLSKMTPDNLRQVVVAKSLQTDKLEPYFGAHYSIEALALSLLKRLKAPKKHKALTIPAVNEFIASDFKLRKSSNGESGEPKRIIHQPGIDVWARTDTSFSMPRASVQIKISTSKASDTVDSLALLQVYESLLSRSLEEYGYPAKEADLNYAVSSDREGLVISIFGYQDKQHLLLKGIMKAMTQFAPDKKDFDREHALLIRACKNKQFQLPYRLVADAVKQIIYRRYPSDEKLLKAAESITFDALKKYVKTFYQDIHIDMLIYGNHARDEAAALAAMVEKALLTPANRSEKYSEPFNLLANEQRVFEMDIKHNDSAFMIYLQRQETDNNTRACYGLLARLLATPFFNSLRTEQQLGYAVFAYPYPVEKHPSVVFLVQSPKVDPLEIEVRFRAFMKEQIVRIKSLTDGELEEYRQGLIGELLQRDINLANRSFRFWASIVQEEPFDNRSRMAEAVRNVSIADIQRGFNVLLEDKGRVIIRSFGEKHQSAKKQIKEKGVCRDLKCFDDLPSGARGL
ncbi:MAG: insulinase family protein [Candidatus Endonucleobacter bathymodioli]|uniref:Protease 3 n=1 Tax=Candidatus Endonucleibacter bathymodioli TaxID=539814 RepID=A0AA90P0H4_9GAMM|nr:insulinase family protein [Candidatus Endonucleobacter bathymodioli]